MRCGQNSLIPTEVHVLSQIQMQSSSSFINLVITKAVFSQRTCDCFLMYCGHLDVHSSVHIYSMLFLINDLSRYSTSVSRRW